MFSCTLCNNNYNKKVKKCPKCNSKDIIEIEKENNEINATIINDDNLYIERDSSKCICCGMCKNTCKLRENLKDAIKRIDFVIIIGNDRQNLEEYFLKNNTKVFKANIKEKIKNINNNQKYIAFSGIGRPEKFFNSLKKVGCNVIKEISFEDHHIYTNNEIEKILLTAKKENAKVITTSKDWIKLAKNYCII